jgi:ribonuclease P/MRP protein subunit RPP1
MNRFAVEQPALDVLAHPMAGDGDLNHVLAKAARDNGVRLEVDLGPVLRSAGGRRVRAIADLRKLLELIEAYDVPFVVGAGATSHLELRSPRELVALCERLGFDAEQAESGLAEWGRLADRNRERQSDRFVEPGVWREG